ncbi:MAG TPA: flavin reductase family protein [Candidatus Fournierella merdavium]|uniref:flavin reductase family protein n=1 Tax=Candidatus Allofournierella merdavium TaxID=2838593 RepID=UPI001F95AA06|nr:flavin reductase family protein [Candidatus Fournierella merdavium]
MSFEKIELSALHAEPFEMIGRRWMLVTAEKEGKVNTMTASWGGMGVLWGKDVAFAFIRPQRYTKEFVDAAGRFTLSFYGEEHRQALTHLGRVSGRDEDKIARVGFEVCDFDGAPAFAQAQTVLVCRTLYTQPFDPAGFVPGCDADQRWYPGKDYSVMYVAEIEAVYQKNE